MASFMPASSGAVRHGLRPAQLAHGLRSRQFRLIVVSITPPEQHGMRAEKAWNGGK